MLLPLRIPLSTLISSAPPGLDPADEVYYSTAELTAASYDGSTLRFQFNTPSDGEIALRLSRQPQAVRLDGGLPAVYRALSIFSVSQFRIIARFEHTLALEYLSDKPRIVFQGRTTGFPGNHRRFR